MGLAKARLKLVQHPMCEPFSGKAPLWIGFRLFVLELLARRKNITGYPMKTLASAVTATLHFLHFNRKHHCRNCGNIYCDNCTKGRTALTADEGAEVVRVCDRCLAEVTKRLTNAKDTSKVTVPVSHDVLAKMLQEELERNAGRKEFEKMETRKNSTTNHTTQVCGRPTSKGSGARMQEVACPTCTVHLQVQVPSHGTETVKCGVCEHPFLVAA